MYTGLWKVYTTEHADKKNIIIKRVICVNKTIEETITDAIAFCSEETTASFPFLENNTMLTDSILFI